MKSDTKVFEKVYVLKDIYDLSYCKLYLQLLYHVYKSDIDIYACSKVVVLL